MSFSRCAVVDSAAVVRVCRLLGPSAVEGAYCRPGIKSRCAQSSATPCSPRSAVAVGVPVLEDALLDVSGPAVFEAALHRPPAVGVQIGEQAVVDDLPGIERV